MRDKLQGPRCGKAGIPDCVQPGRAYDAGLKRQAKGATVDSPVRTPRGARSARGAVNIVVLLIFRHSPPPLDALFANASQLGWKRRKAVVTDESDIPGGVVHDLPADLSDALSHDAKALATWQDITPLARNEWICWVESAKKEETRRKRILWGRSSLSEGKRRPCCWPGCPHRGAKP